MNQPHSFAGSLLARLSLFTRGTSLPRRPRKHQRATSRFQPTLEMLEHRCLLSVLTWTGSGVNDLWSNPGNWVGGASPFFVPADGDDVVIPETAGSAEVLFDVSVIGGGVIINSLTSDEPFRVIGDTLSLDGAGPFQFNRTVTLSAGQIAGTGTTTAMNGGLIWSGGTLGGVGITNANAGITLTGSPQLINHTLNNHVATTYNGVNSNFFGIGGGTFNNLATASFTIEGNDDVPGGTFNNLGTFIKRAGASGDGITRFTGFFNNSGTVDVQSGTLDLEGGGTHTGDFDFTGAIFEVKGGTQNFNSGSDLTGTTFGAAGGTYLVVGTFRFPNADIVSNGATIVLSGPSSQIINHTTGGNGIANFSTNTAAGNFTIQNGRNLTTSGAFSNAGIVSIGSSSMFNTTGNYSQSAGTTTLAGGALAASPAVNLNGGALVGSGIVSGNLVNGGQVSPGASPGLITINGNYSQTGALNIELNGSGAGSLYDQLNVNGTVSLGGTFNPTLGFASVIGDAFTIIDNNLSDVVSGTFSGLPEASIITLGGCPFRLNYNAGTGNDVVLTHINERPYNVGFSISPTTLNESQSATLSDGSFGDCDLSQTHAVTINWGDGSTPDTLNLAAGVLSFGPVSHTYTDDPTGSPDEFTVTVTVTDSHPESGSNTATVTVNNVAPTATLSNNGPVVSTIPATVSFSNQLDPSSADTTAGFHFAFSCTNGDLSGATYASSGTSSSTTCTYNDGPSTHTVRARIIDKDDGFSENTSDVTVTVPQLSISNASVMEGTGNSVDAVFTVSLSTASSVAITVNFETADGTANAPADYAATNGTLTFSPGATSMTVTVPVAGDSLHEATETFFVNLSGATNATIADGEGLGTITDDDPPPMIQIADVTVTEGTGGAVDAVFTVSLSAASGLTVTVNFATFNATAIAPADYGASSGSLSFAPGETTKTIAVAVAGDNIDEPTEVFCVKLSGAADASIADSLGVAFVLDDDPPPILSINDVSVTEGNSGTVNAVFTVNLSAPHTQTVTVKFATASGTASLSTDYTAVTGTLSFSPGQTTKSVTVPVKGDTLFEPNETFFVNLTSPTNAPLADSQGKGTITNDDPAPPSLSIADVSVTEGNSGTVNAVFTVTLSAASTQTVTVKFASANGTAVSTADYVSKTGTLTFNPGVTSQTITVVVNGDTLHEAAETFLVNLTSPTNAILADGQGVGTIEDNDLTPSITITDVTVTEGTGTTVNAVFTVKLSVASGRTTTVDFTTTNDTATAPGDYSIAAGTLSFPAGVTTKTITVPVVGDAIDEANETFFVDLSNASGATLADNQGKGTITDNDLPPSMKISDAATNESACCAVFTVSLSAPSGQTVSVNFATANGSALAPTDYRATSGTLSFAPGETTKLILVEIIDDLLAEASETFSVNLTGALNAVLSDGIGLGQILNDD